MLLTFMACDRRSILVRAMSSQTASTVVPIPNDGSILDEPEKYHAIFTAIDGDSMEVCLAGHGGREPGQL